MRMNSKKNLIEDRRDAAMRLKEQLSPERLKTEKWHLVAVSKGGLELAGIMNERLKLPIDFLFSATIYAPQNRDCEIACVSEREEIVIHENLIEMFDIQLDYIYGEASRKHEEKIIPQIYKFRKGRHFAGVKGETVLLVDEGAESGLKMMTAIKTVMAMKPKAVYLAVGVLPSDVMESLEPLVDGIYYLYNIDDFVETTTYYASLPAVKDATIETILGE